MAKKSSLEKKEAQKLQVQIKKVLDLALQSGCDDNVLPSQAWIIDQMVRVLTGCPTVRLTSTQYGKRYTYKGLGESKEYREFVRKARQGEDGPDTYNWNIGSP